MKGDNQNRELVTDPRKSVTVDVVPMLPLHVVAFEIQYRHFVPFFIVAILSAAMSGSRS